MKFVADQEELLVALEAVNKIAKNRESNPILRNALVVAKNDALTLTAFDLSIAISVEVEAAIEVAGEYTFPCELLTESIKAMPSMALQFELIDESLKISFLGGESEIQGISADQYPQLPENETGQIELPCLALKTALNNALVSISTDIAKAILTGIHIRSNEGCLEFASTNGHHLSVYHSDLPAPKEFEALTIPATAIKPLLKKLEELNPNNDFDETVSFSSGKQIAGFSVKNFKLISRLLDGQYPRYFQLIPKDFKHEVNINASLLQAELKAVKYFASLNRSIFTVNFNTENARLSAGSKEQGGVISREILCETVKGKPEKMAFDCNYMIAGASAFSGTATLHMNSPTNPVVFTSESDPRHTFLIMPIQIRE